LGRGRATIISDWHLPGATVNRPVLRLLATVPLMLGALAALGLAALALETVPAVPVLIVAVLCVGAALLWPAEVPQRAPWTLLVAALAMVSAGFPEGVLLVFVARFVVLAVRGLPPGGLLGGVIDASGTVMAAAVALPVTMLVPWDGAPAALAAGVAFVLVDRFVALLPLRAIIDGSVPGMASLFGLGPILKGGVAVGAGVALGGAVLVGPVEGAVAALAIGMLPQLNYVPPADKPGGNDPVVQFAAMLAGMDAPEHVYARASQFAGEMLEGAAEMRKGTAPDESLGEVGVLLYRNNWLVVRPGARGPGWRENALATLGTIKTLCVPVLDSVSKNEGLRTEVHTDSLTGALNKAGLNETLEESLLAQERLALLYLDLDKFKPVNDTYGHSAGDEILRAVVRRITDLLRPGDHVARVGGDEFVVLLRNFDASASIEKIGERILGEMAKRFPIGDGSTFVTIGASIGITISRPEDTPESLTDRADEAMYHVKAAGRGQLNIV
jgi:diguanylate cyclase (GGDEF)-like protein